MIIGKDLIKEYNDEAGQTQALAGVSFEIKQGEFVSIMGPSGSGKSTLLHILSFMDRPTGGIYNFNDHNINNLSDIELARIRNREMGFVFQAFNLLARYSVYENVELPLLYSNLPVDEREARVTLAIRSVGLSEKIFVETATLSGGQKQRVAIARALVNNPNVIFADEPTGNLDSKSGAQVMSILKELNEKGRTIILVTHETSTASFASRLIRVRDGMIESDQAIKSKKDLENYSK